MILLLVIAFVGLFYVLQTKYYSKHWKKGLSATLSFSKGRVNEGDELELIEVVENAKWLPIPHLHVKFMTANSFTFENCDNSVVTDNYYRNDIFTLIGYQTTKRTLKFKANKRGFYDIKSVDLISGDIFFRRTFASHDENVARLYVFPKLIERSELNSVLLNNQGEINTLMSLNVDEYSYIGTREYVPGDPLNHINWKRSAKDRSLMTNIFSPVIEHEVTMIVNLCPFYENDKMRLLEYIIRIVATLGSICLDNNVHLHIYTNAYELDQSKVLNFPSLNSKSREESLMMGLAAINLKREPEDIVKIMKGLSSRRINNQSLVFISNDRTNAVIDAYKELSRSFKNHMFIMPEYAAVPVKATVPDMISWEVPV